MKQYLLKVWMTAALSLLVVGGVWGQESYTPGYPNVSDITHESATLNVSASVGGYSVDPLTWPPIAIPKYYSCYVVLPSNQNPPTISQVLSGEDSNSVPVGINFQGKIGLMSPGYVFSGSISGLAADTEYVVYLVTTEDDFQPVVIETTEPTSVSFSTITGPTPLTATLSPADDAPNVPVSTSTFVLTFSEDIEFTGAGNMYAGLYKNGSSVEGQLLATSNGNVVIDNLNNSLTISFSHSFDYDTGYYITIPSGAVQAVATAVEFPGLSAGEWSFTTEAAPFTIDYQVPEDGAIDVALNASLVATFNQNIQLGTSAAVHIYDYLSESLVETITTGLSVSGSDLIINPTTDLAEGTHYYVVIPSGAVETTSGAPFAGLTNKDAWDFTTAYLPLENPILSPAHNAVGVLKDAVLSLQFDKDIELGSGTIAIYTSSGQEKLFDASSPSVSIVNDNTLQIDLSNNALADYETVYDVRIAPTLIKRVGSDVYFAGFGAGEWSFTTEVQPDPVLMITSSLSPADGAVEVSRAPTLQVSFDQEITWGPSGVLTIHRSDNDATAATISREQTGASISQDQLSIVFSSESLEYGTEYYVIIDEGFVKALNSSAVYAGLSDKTVWTFTTETAPPFWAVEEGYPMIANQTAADFDLLGKVDQGGTYYFVVSEEDDMLTYEEIRTAALSGGTGGFLAVGNDVVVANTVFSTTISTGGLEPGFNYNLFVYTSSGDKDGEIVRLTIDRTAPKLRTTGTFPSAGYSVLPIDADIVLTFSEKIYGVEEGVLVELTTANAGSFIELVTGETSVSTEISVSEGGRVFTLSPTVPLSENTSYSVVFAELSDAKYNVAAIPAHTFSTDGLNEWTGLGAAGNWDDASNWSGGYAAGKSVIIPVNSLANYPVISADVEVNNLTIDAGAVLTHNGGVLTVLGEFILKSSVDVNASYIINGGTPDVDGDKVRVEQVIDDVYMTYLISAPTDGTTATNFGGYFPLYLFDNATDTWPAVTFSHPMQAGVGYRMWTDDPIVFFSGEFNTGGVQVPLSYTSGKGYGWNLVGNPYAASIDWNLLDVASKSQNIENNFWIWMPTGRAYGAYSASTTIPLNIESSIIPSNHAFLVKVVSPEDSAFINFDPAAQVANSGNYLKSGKASATSYVKFAGVSGKVRDEMAVAFIDDASMGLDKYDMEKRFANQNHVLELFTNVGDMQAAINAVPLDGNYEVALGYNAMVAGDFSIEMVKDNTDNVSCVLVDKSLELEQELRPGDRYEFSAAKGKNITRFALKFSKIVTSERDIERPVADFSCHVLENEIFVDFDNAHNGLRFQVADVQGRILKQGSILDSSKFSVGVYEQGVYVLTFNDLNGQWYGSQKVVVY